MLRTLSFELLLTLAVAAVAGCGKDKTRPAEQPVGDLRRALLAALLASRTTASGNEPAGMASASLAPPSTTANPPVTNPTPSAGPAAPPATAAEERAGPVLEPPAPPEAFSERADQTPPQAPEGSAAVARTEAPPEGSPGNAVAEPSEARPAEPEQATSTPEEAEMGARAAAIVDYLVSLYGGGSGFTGVSAGQSGFTGIGAGDSGFTGAGAGSGYTGIGAEPVPEVNGVSPSPGLLLCAVRPWFLYPMP